MLLTPTTIYAGALLRPVPPCAAPATTCTGWPTSPAAACRATCRVRCRPTAARLDPTRWRMPSIVRLIGALGGLDDEELRATFNGGLGMIAVVAPAAVSAAIGALASEADRGDARRRGRARRRRRPALRRGAARSASMIERADRRRRLGRRLEPAGAPPRPRRGELGGEIVARRRRSAVPRARLGRGAGDRYRPRPGGRRRAFADALAGARPDVVVLAGYMRLVGPRVAGRLRGRILNTHPSLLPAFPGAHAVRDALAPRGEGERATVHLVDETLDGGPIVAQEAVPILDGDDETSLHARIRAVEHRLLPRAVALVARRGDRSAAPGGRPHRRRPGRGALPVPRRALLSVSDKTGLVDFGARPGRSRLRARLDRRHGASAARRRPAGDRRRRRHRLRRRCSTAG